MAAELDEIFAHQSSCLKKKRDGHQPPRFFFRTPSRVDSLEVQVLCAGINRHEVENVRVSRERISDLLGPEFCTKRREAFSEA